MDFFFLSILTPVAHQSVVQETPRSIATTFFLTVGLSLWPIIVGLIIGGVIAAPFAAVATKHIPDQVLMLLVGCVVVLLSLRTIVMVLAPGQ